MSKQLLNNLNEIKNQKDTYLLPENIKKDVTVLGITGTYEGSGGGTVEGIKQFATIEEMNNSTGNTEGDLAIVYRNTLANMVADTETQYITFPDTVTLPTAFTGDDFSDDALQAVDSSVSFDSPQVMLSQTSFVFDRFSDFDEYTINVEYTSVDGITYTRSTTITNPVDLGTVVKPGTLWNYNFGYFMKVDSASFTGLYKYSGTAWELAPTDLTTVADDVYSTKFYGKTGVTTGTLATNVSNSFADTNAAVYGNIQQAYDSMTPRVLTDTDKTIDKNIYFIPVKKDGIVLLDTSSVTNMDFMFYNCTNLTEIPLLDTSSVISMYQMFYKCTNLATIPQLDMSSATDTRYMFTDCASLTDESLNNILAMCANESKIMSSSYKTLAYIGLTEEQATKCTTLSNYSAFTAAGWTTGY